jgi:hypothetical protein
MKKYLFLFLFPMLGFAQFEQYIEDDPHPVVKKEGGGGVSVIETGTGFGGFYAIPIRNNWHAGAALEVFILRDSKEFDYFGYTYNRINNVYLFDLLLTFKKRLFARDIHDSVRPYLLFGAGPVYGINYPENSTDEDVPDAKNQFLWSYSAVAAAGLDADVNDGYFLGFRLQYRQIVFPEKLGERKDQSVIDLHLEMGKRF